MPLNLKKLPGVKQVRNIKDKAAIKLFKEVESSAKERDATIKDLKRRMAVAQKWIDDMAELIAQMDDTGDINEMHKLLTDNNPQYDKQVATIVELHKQLKQQEKKLGKLVKVEGALLKIASKDASVKEIFKS